MAHSQGGHRCSDRSGAHSTPGPDGIPYLAWKRLAALGCDVFFDTAQALEGADALESLGAAFPLSDGGCSQFNAAIMVFIPKKAPLVSAAGIEYTSAADMRPLSIVNTDNRLLANALRLRIEPLVARAISMEQQGVLPGVR